LNLVGEPPFHDSILFFAIPPAHFFAKALVCDCTQLLSRRTSIRRVFPTSCPLLDSREIYFFLLSCFRCKIPSGLLVGHSVCSRTCPRFLLFFLLNSYVFFCPFSFFFLLACVAPPWYVEFPLVLFFLCNVDSPNSSPQPWPDGSITLIIYCESTPVNSLGVV